MLFDVTPSRAVVPRMLVLISRRLYRWTPFPRPFDRVDRVRRAELLLWRWQAASRLSGEERAQLEAEMSDLMQALRRA